MKTMIKVTSIFLLFSCIVCAYTVIPELEKQESPGNIKETVMQISTSTPPEFVPSPEPAQWIMHESGEVHVLTPKLTLNSTSDEIREKMLSSFINWQTMEVQAIWEQNFLISKDMMTKTLKYEINSWVDQTNMRFRTEEQQVDTDDQPRLFISNGTIMVSREPAWVVEGYPDMSASTRVYNINIGDTGEETLELLRRRDEEFSPLGRAYFGFINEELFSSAYAFQYPGDYDVLGLEMIAGRETLKAFYDGADRLGHSNIQYTLWIDTETGVVLKTWSEGKSNHDSSGMEITHITYNVSLDENIFTIEEAVPDLNLSNMQSDTVNGITIFIDQPRIKHRIVLLDICYELPSNMDWMISNLSADNKEQIVLDGRLIYNEPGGIFQDKGLRCVELVFLYPFTNNKLHIEIGEMNANLHQVEACNASDQVLQDLIDGGTTIEFNCEEDDGLVLTEILTKPDTMTEEEAKKKVLELLLKYQTKHLQGPWVFDIPIAQE